MHNFIPQHSTRWTQTIFAEGCALPAEGSHFATMFQKYCTCHENMTRGHTKCCTGHKKTLRSGIKPFDLNITSIVLIHGACRVKCSPSNDARLPAVWQRPRNTAPATISNTCPLISLRLPRKLTFQTPTCEDSMRLTCKMHFVPENVHGRLVKRCLKNCEFRDAYYLCELAQSKWTWTFDTGTFVRACANETRGSERIP